MRAQELLPITDGGMTRYFRPTSSPPGLGDLIYFPLFPTIDMVCLWDQAGNCHYHSSKPPLLSTMVAAIVWSLEKVARVSFSTRPAFHDGGVADRRPGDSAGALRLDLRALRPRDDLVVVRPWLERGRGGAGNVSDTLVGDAEQPRDRGVFGGLRPVCGGSHLV